MSSIITSPPPTPDNFELTKTIRGEQEDFIRALEIIIQGAEDNEPVDLSNIHIPHRPGTPFDEAYEPGRVLLEKMVHTSDFSKLSEALTIFDKETCLRVNVRGDLDVRRHTPWISLRDEFRYFPGLEHSLSVIGELAEMAGGYIYFNDPISVEQWLTFHQFNIPKTVGETKNLIRFLHLDLPDASPVGNYWQAISGAESSPFLLSAAERERVMALTREVFKHPHEILEELARPVISDKSIEQVEAGAGYLLDQILETERAIEYGREYLAAVEWYGTHDGQDACKEHVQSLLLAAVILGFDSSAGQTRNQIAGYDLYQPGNVDRSPLAVRGDLEDHLAGLNKEAGRATPLASFILLAGIAPEFLVRDLPESLRLGSPAWVTFSQAVALAELNDPGSSRMMTYSQLLDFAALEPVTSELSLLHSVVAINPIINWAALNGVISADTHGNYNEHALHVATSAFSEYIGHFDSVIHALTSPLPSRQALALSQLQKELPGCDYLDKKILVQAGKGFYANRGSSLKMSMVDLHMSDDLALGEWDRSGTSIYKSFPQITSLYPVSELFDPAFDAYYKKLEAGVVTNIKLALAQLPDQDRIALQVGEISFYTIRESVAALHSTPASSVGLVGVNTKPAQRTERQIDKDAAICRYGIVLCATYQGRVSCYEVFTLRGECRKNTRLGRLLVDSGKLNSTSRLDFKGNLTDPSPAVAPFHLPIDFAAYSQGVAPRDDISSKAVIEKLGVLSAPSILPPLRSSPYHSFCTEQFEAIARFIFKHRPFATYEELYRNAEGRTALELEREKAERIGTFIIDLIVPFKKCIEDLSSDDKTRQAEGAVGCIIDGLAILAVVIGVPAQFANAAAKTASLAAKTAHLARIGVGVTLSILNPLDDTPQLLFGGVNLLKKGFLKLSKQGAVALDNATFQLQRLTGRAQSYDLFRAANRTDVRQGTWQSLGDSAEAVSILAIRHKHQWYALNLRTGEPWGPALKNFRVTNDLVRVPGLHRVMPKSYARTVITNALPIAGRKIDFAIDVLGKRIHDGDSKFVLKAFFGSDSDEVIEWYLDGLKIMRDDLKTVSISNFTVDGSSAGDVMGGLYTNRYKAWQASTKADQAHEQFIVFYADQLNHYYRRMKYDDSRIADILVHEMSHGGPGTLDFFYADKSLSKSSGLGDTEVSELLNLAKGSEYIAPSSRLAGKDVGVLLNPSEGDIVPFLNEAPGLLNADSQAVVTSLLSQSVTNAPAFQANLSHLRAMLKEAGNKRITGPIRLNLGQGSIPVR